jgi:hypothetical protein
VEEKRSVHPLLCQLSFWEPEPRLFDEIASLNCPARAKKVELRFKKEHITKKNKFVSPKVNDFFA